MFSLLQLVLPRLLLLPSSRMMVCICLDLHFSMFNRSADATLDMGGLDIESELFEPLQKLLNQCKGAKTLSR